MYRIEEKFCEIDSNNQRLNILEKEIENLKTNNMNDDRDIF